MPLEVKVVKGVAAGVGELGFRGLNLLQGLLAGVGGRFFRSGRGMRWDKGLGEVMGSIVFVLELGDWS